MAEWFQSGRIVDVIILGMLLEAALLLLWYRRTGRGLRPDLIATTVLAGICLMLACRAALTGAAWPWISFFMLLGGAAHLLDLWRRLR